jgi:hypothetical protein
MFVSPFLLLPLLSTLLATRKNNRKTTNNNYLTNTHHALLHQVVGGQKGDDDDSGICKSTSSIWIDMENVRGKSGFQLTHREVLDKTDLWTKHFRLEDRVIVIVDHGGPAPSGFFLEDKRMAVVFSGNACKADDIIAKGVGASCFPFFGNPNDDENENELDANGDGGKRGKQRKVGAIGKTIVVTADNELIARCRRGAKNEYHIVNPQTFLDDLEWVVGEVRQQQRQEALEAEKDNIIGDEDSEEESSSTTTTTTTTTTEALSLQDEFKLGRLDSEIKIRGQLIDAEVQLGDKKKRKRVTNKRRKKLESKIQALRRKLALRGPSLLDQLTSDIDSDGENESGEASLAREQQDLLLARWRDLQKRPPQKEQTGDRVIYAERLRRELEADDNVTKDMGNDDNGTMLPSAKLFVKHINDGKIFETPVPNAAARATISSVDDIVAATKIAPSPKLTKEQRLALMTSGPVVPAAEAKGSDSTVVSDRKGVTPPDLSTKQRLEYEGGENSKKLQTLDIVVVSDTHGFEGQLGDKLPDGDVLLHLGDFALEGSHEKEARGLQDFDTWLARQNHKYKIVVRGNHDPFKLTFPASKAMYVTNPCSINVAGFEFALVPHCNARKLSASGGLPPTCDLIASHVPPFKVLDRTLSGKHAGSSFLNNVVRGMAFGPPRLWLVGHIHEGRGIAKRKFARNKHQETTVINASNANMGCATHLDHGPVVVRIDKDDPEVKILQMDDKNLDKVQLSSNEAAFFQQTTASDNGSDAMESGNGYNHLLMSVDLGLKSGVSLFNSRGNLIRYEQFLFDRENLQEDFEEIIRKWEDEVADDNEDESNPWKITHIAIEGGDTGLLDTWAQAAPNHSILRVTPHEWRSELLNNKESQSGSSAKEASRLIARQIVADYGTMEHHAGKFPTDVAESVCLGMYVARRLGWIERKPAVRRFTNGNVVTPKKVPVHA